MPSVTRRPIELKDLYAKRTRFVEIAWGEADDERFVVGYRPDSYTNEVHARLQLFSAEEGLDAMADLMASLICEWDIQQDGEPYPITEDSLHALGLPLLGAIAEAVQSDFSLGKPTSTALSVGSNGTSP